METNKIYAGDNCVILADEQEFPDSSVDCVITSPPYFQQRDYNGLGMGNETEIDDYLAKLLITFDHLYRITKPNGTIVINLGDKIVDGNQCLVPYRFAIAVLDHYSRQKKHLCLINDITWVKMNPTPRQDKTRLNPATEPFFIFAKSSAYFFDKSVFQSTRKSSTRKSISEKYGMKYRRDIDGSNLTDSEKAAAHAALDAAIEDVRNNVIAGIRMKLRGVHALAYGGQEGGRNNAIRRDGFSIIRLFDEEMKRDIIEETVETISSNKHPAVYPVRLIEELIQLLTPVHGIVIDPFMGSGTTAIAAINTQRNFVGIEIDPDYLAFAQDRIELVKTNTFNIL